MKLVKCRLLMKYSKSNGSLDIDTPDPITGSLFDSARLDCVRCHCEGIGFRVPVLSSLVVRHSVSCFKHCHQLRVDFYLSTAGIYELNHGPHISISTSIPSMYIPPSQATQCIWHVCA